MPVFKKNRIRWAISQASTPPSGTYEPTHWVSDTASGSGDGSFMTPWTLAQAWASPATGKRVCILPGTYVTPGNPNAIPVFMPTPGENGLPNIFFAQYRATVAAEANWSKIVTQNGIGSITGINSYNTFDGLYFAQLGTHTFIGEGHAISGHQNYDVVGVKVLHCFFDGTNSTQCPDSGTNWGAVFLQDVDNFEMADCLVRGYIGTGHSNHTAMELYDCSNYHVHHCNFETCTAAIYPKGTNTGEVKDLVPASFHHNMVVDCAMAMNFGNIARYTPTATDMLAVYQNLFLRSGPVVFRFEAHNVQLVNNTFVDGTGLEWIYCNISATPTLNDSWINTVIRNNLIVDQAAGRVWTQDDSATLGDLAARADFGRNMYRGVYQYHNNGDFNTWNTAQGGEELQGDPQFVNEVGENFRLATGSPAINAGTDILNLTGGGTINLGCYVGDQTETIGKRAA